MLKTTATKYGLKTISDLKKVPNLSFAGYPECDKRITCLLGLKQIYGLTQLSSSSSPRSASTRCSTRARSRGRRVLDRPAAGELEVHDPHGHEAHLRLPERRARRLAEALSAAGPKFAQIVNAVSAKLTTQAMIAMNKAVAIDKATPAAVAAAFLKANGLA